MRNIVIPQTYQENETLADAYRDGFNHGHGIACHNVPRLGEKISLCVDWVGYRYVTAENIRDVHEMCCFQAEPNSRQFSPFEFTANELNEAGKGDDENPSSDELWEAFEAGTADAIRADIDTYSDADYGIEGDR